MNRKRNPKVEAIIRAARNAGKMTQAERDEFTRRWKESEKKRGFLLAQNF